ncbi:hypothetical protein [Halopiger djelfimassiliensis]|uniref:hypothetical protein n=1 Tax=Halopiger djelfimassiliensis TaxID=1293047 RepID=UPI000677E3D5|nr:hypothetical protein [Halopiger djelfimassiliensis]
MIGTDLAVAGCVLALAVATGLVAHEWTHAFVLRLARIDYAVSYAPDRTGGIAGIVTSCPWAVVHPRPDGHEPPWVLRVAALAPLLLALPVVGLELAGVLSTESPVVLALAIGWLACAIPSPQDFSVVFYAHRVLETAADASTGVSPSRAD